MASKNLGITIEIGGNTTKLSQALEQSNKTINQSQKNLKELDKLSKLDPKNLSLYIAKQKEVASAVNATKEKLKVLKDAEKQVKEQFKNGEISTGQWVDFQKQLSSTKTNLKSLESQSFSFTNILKGMGGAAVNIGKTVLTGLATAFAATATAAIAAGTAIFSMVSKAGNAADDLNTMSKVTGISTEELQKFQYAAEIIDVPLETIAKSNAKLIKSMDSARDGSKEYQKAFKELGVEVTNADGSLRNNNDVFKETIKALGNVKNETERDALAMQLFGKSAQDLNPLILGGADALDELGQKAEDAGLILSQDALDSLNEVTDATDEFKSIAKQVGMVFSTVFSEDIANAVTAINDFVKSLMKAYSEEGMGGLVAVIQESLQSMLLYIQENLPMFLESGMNILMNLIQGIVDNAPIIIDTVIAVLTAFINTVINNLPQIIQLGIQLLSKLVEGFFNFLPTLLTSIPQIVLAICNGFAQSMPDILQIGVNIVKGIWDGIVSMGSWLMDQVFGFFGGVLDGIKDFLGIHSPSTLFADEVGKFMAQGVGVGFNNEFVQVKKGINSNIGSSIKISNQFSFGGSYKRRDGINIAKDINRQLGLAYR